MVLWCSLGHYFGQVQGVTLGLSIEPDSRASSSVACGPRTARPQQSPAHPHCTLQLSARAQLAQRALGQCLSPVSAPSTGKLRVSTHSSLSTDYRRLHVPVPGSSALPYLFFPVYSFILPSIPTHYPGYWKVSYNIKFLLYLKQKKSSFHKSLNNESW